MRWPWRRRESDGEHARATKATADRHLAQAQQQARQAAETTRAARLMAHTADQFARDVERSLHMRGPA